eukprot:gene28703-37940_t
MDLNTQHPPTSPNIPQHPPSSDDEHSPKRLSRKNPRCFDRYTLPTLPTKHLKNLDFSKSELPKTRIVRNQYKTPGGWYRLIDTDSGLDGIVRSKGGFVRKRGGGIVRKPVHWGKPTLMLTVPCFIKVVYKGFKVRVPVMANMYGIVDASADMKTPPVEQLQAMTGEQFFAELARLLISNPPSLADAAMIAELATLGIEPGEPWNGGELDPAMHDALDGAVAAAIQMLRSKAGQIMATSVNGWRIPKMDIGAFGTNYELRALIALIAIGANIPADSIYPTAYDDAAGEPLNGAN